MIIDNDTLAARLKARYDARQKEVDKLVEMSHAATKKVARMDQSAEEKQVERWIILNWPKAMILEELKKRFRIGEIEGAALIKLAKQKLGY